MENDRMKYHYTNVDALINILKEKKIRLTHFNDLKDTTEGRYLLEMLKNDLKCYKEIYSMMTRNFFVSCFCAYGDLISQWKEYGCVNIGFDFEAMKHDMKFVSDRKGMLPDTSGTQLVDCCYATCDDESYKSVLKFIKGNFEAIDWCSIQSQQHAYLTCDQCFQLKPIEFKEEHESRIVSHLWRKEPFDNNGKKYIEFHFTADKVESITINLSLCGDMDQERITRFLNDTDEYTHAEVKYSDVVID
jgi:hypothetical protein